jgi:hypothetical protein
MRYPIHPPRLIRFLDEANKHGYANAKAKKVPSTRPKSEDYHYEKGNLTYHDTYFGGRNFIGEEIVYKDGEPVWGMNYYGFIIDPNMNEGDIYVFLRKALMQVGSDIPVRGPQSFSDGDWSYAFNSDGGFEHLSGQEEIFHKGAVVYRAFVHAGFIVK